jgi:hypothetical protein
MPDYTIFLLTVTRVSFLICSKCTAGPGRKQATVTEDFDVRISYL